MTKCILEAKNLTKHYPLSNGQFLSACNSISFQLKKGQAMGIIGESGSGKSTLVKMLMLMTHPTEGDIFFKNNSLLSLKRSEVKQLRPKMQMIFQSPEASLNPRMKIGKIITEPLSNYQRYSTKERKNKAKELLEMVGLPAITAALYPHNLSGGQCQRVSIARALSLDPEVLICDEATSALDASSQRTIMGLLKKLQQEKRLTILFVTHDLALIHELTPDILVLHKGRIIEQLSKTHSIFDSAHPCTKNLVKGIFSLKEIKENLGERRMII